MINRSSIVVVGGAGFIGYHLCKKLLIKEASVLCIDNLISGSVDNINKLSEYEKFTFINADICNLDLSEIDKWSMNVDWIINLASLPNPSDFLKYPQKTLDVGYIATKRLLEYCSDMDIKYLFASSSSVYGDPMINTQTEEYLGNVNNIGLRSVYEESKRIAETLIYSYFRETNISVRVARLFNIYGPRMLSSDNRLIPRLINTCLESDEVTIYGNGDQVRTYCYIDDAIDGIISLMYSSCIYPINIGNNNEYKIIDIYSLITKLIVELYPDEVFNFEYRKACKILNDPIQLIPDIMKAKYVLNWKPTTTLKDGLIKTIQYFYNKKTEVENAR